MIYEFVDVDNGERVEAVFSMDEAPPIGETRHIGARLCRRVASRPEQANVPNVYFTCHQLPRNYPYAKHFDAWGSPVFSSKHELDECIAKANVHGEDLAWNR